MKRVVFKLHDIPTEDPLSFILGFNKGYRGHRLSDHQKRKFDSITHGYILGCKVRAGKANVPTWMKIIE